MKIGAGIFWLLVILLFGGAAYFALEVTRMKEATAQDAAAAEAAVPAAEANVPATVASDRATETTIGESNAAAPQADMNGKQAAP